MRYILHCLRFATFMLISILLSGCTSTQQVVIDPATFLYDQGFNGFETIQIETEEQVFGLDLAAKNFVRDSIRHVAKSSDQMKLFVHDIFDHSKFNLLYKGDANTTASETFGNRAANCLSMSIMTYSLAREAGFGVKFQAVKIPEYWTRRAGYSLLNGHINLRMVPRPAQSVISFTNLGYQVDFDPQNGLKHFPKNFVSKEYVLSMFYNNKGADALLSKNFTKAYAYFRAALQLTPEFDSAWVNLGFLYRLNNFYEQAENAYLQALVIDQNSLTAWENLGLLYQFSDQPDKAKEILAKVEFRRKNNPYYHLNLGERELENHNLQYALQHYRKALSLDKTQHEIYFGLAKTYYQLGELERSQRYLKQAKRKSRNKQEQNKYQGKLDLLSRL
ncbi:MAG: tetratricopeptide (TPR) repeat protein [Paraglaciecola sp.]|jgi:tetratricopeptide (TPR) repeat protein